MPKVIYVNVQQPTLDIAVSVPGIQGPAGNSSSNPPIQEFMVSVPSGSDYLSGIAYPIPFSSIPAVNISLEIPNNVQDIYLFAIQNKNLSGFDVRFSDTIKETGIFLNVIAS
jgi:hypothetical protein